VQECWILGLKARRGEIRRRWEALLRLQRPDTPMADPNNLVHLIGWTLDRVFEGLRSRKPSHVSGPPPTIATLRSSCPCGLNPYIAHFLAGEQALLEALVLVQSEDPALDPVHRDTAVTELYLVLHAIARDEVESVCALCQRQPQPKEPSIAACTDGN
jgi:hypothetical protein